jgi:hypothetical protein
MTVTVTVHGVEYADVVDHTADMGKEIAHPDSILAILLEFPPWLDQVAGKLARLVEPSRGHDRLTVILCQLGLVIERIDVGDATGRVDENYAIGCRGKMCRSGSEGIPWLGLQVFAHAGKCCHGKTARGTLQELSSIRIKWHRHDGFEGF